MKKILALVILGSVITSCGAVLAFRSKLNHPFLTTYPSFSSFSLPGSTWEGNLGDYCRMSDCGSSISELAFSDLLQVKKEMGNFSLIEKVSQPILSLDSSIIANNKELNNPQNLAKFQKIIQSAQQQKLSERPMGEIMQAIAQQFLGAQYKANLLDQSNQETLVVWLDKFDCLLLVETVLAIARSIATQNYSYQTFLDHIRDQRYRNGQLNGYCSRLHYFSDWISDNQRRGTVQNITLNLGGITLHKKLNYMSQHRNKYPRMIGNDSNYQCIVEMENHLGIVPIHYIPTNRIRSIYSKLQPGDIIAVATSADGIDVSHTGLVYQNPNGNMGFIHASPAGMVTIARDLQRYVGNVRKSIGIVVVRPHDPRIIKK